ncbi:antibiotic biosynthesis monooxygenase [Streptomyces sp. RB6PN25]|uniref:Antibiotic biosynthesis monooxygenase n=1 Tax=Streptomyces humicola TaxID=2953240 RepID=A0ABT1Q2V9_9ACTN|nr:antibiotic biosynthesis monooxygenase family protein [Streptomyces humicola]MCQ4084261.1 antibiotic biosynthesis monooxygenase [Streptomyces humicola]
MPGETNGQVMVIVHHQARNEEELAAIGEAYHLISERMADVPGLLGNELLRSPVDPTAVVVVSRWADRQAFHAWEQGADHREDTAPLRPYRDTRLPVPFGIYEVTAAY